MKKTFLLKTLLLLCTFIVGVANSVWGDTSTVTASKVTSSSVNWTGSSNETWNISVTGGATNQNVTSNYAQVGTRTSPSSSIAFSTSGISGTISSIVVNCASYSGKGTISATVDGSAFGTQSQAIPSWSSNTGGNVTFTGSASGAIVITMTNASDGRAMYIKSITVTYTPNGGGSATASINLDKNAVNVTEAEGGGAIAVTYNNINNVDAEVIFYESDGTTQTNNPSWIVADINASNNLEYAYESNTGAARSAYMKVHEKNEDVYSALITITQAAKTVAPPTFTLETGSYMQGTGVVLTATDNTIYYTHTTNGDTPADPTVNSTLYTEPILLSAGTNKIKAIAVDTYGNKSNITSRTFTGISPTELPFNWTGGTKESFNSQNGIVTSGLGSDYGIDNSPYFLKLDGTGDHIEIFTSEKPQKFSMSIKMIGGANSSTITVQESSNGVEFTDVEDLSISGKQNDIINLETSSDFASTTRVIKLLFTKGSNIGVGPIYISRHTESITISEAGWATYYSNHALDFTGITSLTAYTATVDGDAVKFNKVTGKVPANTGLLVSGETTNVPVCSSADPVANILKGVTAETVKSANTIFVLKNGSNGLGFYNNAKEFTVRANSAYIPAENIPSGATARGFISLEDDATGIKGSLTPALSEGEGAWYDLSGRRVAKPTKGVYIVNGKKIIK